MKQALNTGFQQRLHSSNPVKTYRPYVFNPSQTFPPFLLDPTRGLRELEWKGGAGGVETSTENLQANVSSK